MRPFNPKDAIIKAGGYTPFPNWFWEQAARVLPTWLVIFWGVILRNSVGFGRQKVLSFTGKPFSQRQLAEETWLHTDAISKSAHFLAAVQMISYTPGAGTRPAEIIVWPEGRLPTPHELEASFGAIYNAVDFESKERAAGREPSVKSLCEFIRKERARYLARSGNPGAKPPASGNPGTTHRLASGNPGTRRD